MVLPTSTVGPTVHRLEEGLEATHHDLVGAIVVVAVARRAVDELLPEGFVTDEVRAQGLAELGEGEAASSKTCCLMADRLSVMEPIPDSLDVTRVVAGSTGVVVAARGDTVVDDERQKRRRRILGVGPLARWCYRGT